MKQIVICKSGEIYYIDYEYVCAKALEDITGIGNEMNNDGTKRWTTAKEYLEIFMEEVK